MARVNVDSSTWTDPRVKRLARRCGWSMRETVGTLVAVWQEAYNARSEHMSALDIDTAAELVGFSDHLASPDIGLAGPGPDALLRLHGVQSRIQYLITQAERGSKGGHVTQALARGSLKQPSSNGQANDKQWSSLPLALPPDLPPDPAPDLYVGDAAAAPRRRVSQKRKPGDITTDEREMAARILSKLSEKNGIKYTGSTHHVQLIASQLRSGVSEGDMRAVVANQASKWLKDEQMRHYLTPETLFGPRTIHKYLDEARTRYASEISELEPQPMLSVVK